MIFLKQKITDLLSSTITEDYADWSEATTYVYETDSLALTNASVAVYDRFYWRSYTNANTGNIPQKGSAYWYGWEVSNKQAMLDLRSTTKSTTAYDYTQAGTTTTIAHKKRQRIYDSVNDKVYNCILDSTIGILLTNTTYFTESSLDIVVVFARDYLSTMIAIGNFSASELKIEYLDATDTVLTAYTQTYAYGTNDTVFDYYDYIYEPYSDTIDRYLKIDTVPFGTKIRVTLSKNILLNYAECGFLVYGEPIEMGKTLDDPQWTPNSYTTKDFDTFGRIDIIKRAVQDTVSFQTIYDSLDFPQLKRKIKTNLDEIAVFILDESATSQYENMITLGIMESPSMGTKTSSTKSTINWRILEVT